MVFIWGVSVLVPGKQAYLKVSQMLFPYDGRAVTRFILQNASVRKRDVHKSYHNRKLGKFTLRTFFYLYFAEWYLKLYVKCELLIR